MMTTFDLRILGKITAALLLGVALAGAPALAEKGGNGKGGNGGNGGQGGGSSRSESSKGGGGKSETAGAKSTKSAKVEKAAKGGSAADEDGEEEDGEGAVSASSFGNINGFLHASPNALKHASENSLIGRVVTVYGDQLRAYLDPEDGVDPTLEDLKATLEDIANKPVTPEMIEAINQKLLENDTELTAELLDSGRTLEQLNQEVDTGQPAVIEETTGGETTEGTGSGTESTL